MLQNITLNDFASVINILCVTIFINIGAIARLLHNIIFLNDESTIFIFQLYHDLKRYCTSVTFKDIAHLLRVTF